ncbi:hypothetical protein D3C79_1064950 [compost metagenome]
MGNFDTASPMMTVIAMGLKTNVLLDTVDAAAVHPICRLSSTRKGLGKNRRVSFFEVDRL